MSVLIIAEPGMTWDRKLDNAYRLIDAAKACGADVCKFQWTSSGKKIQERRKVDPKYIAIYEHGVQYPREWLELLKAHCDRVGIEFACTTYLIEDIAVVAPLVKFFKISAYESEWREFVSAHCNYSDNKFLVMSVKEGQKRLTFCHDTNFLHCVSMYPTPMSALHLSKMQPHDGLSDHTADCLTGALAVMRRAPIIEAHIKLWDTDHENPDFPHSLVADVKPAGIDGYSIRGQFYQYVQNIRRAELAL